MVILGIDPGVVICGYSLIGCEGSRVVLYDCGIVKMSSSTPLPERVGYLYEFFLDKIISCHVTDISLETPFLGKSAQNFLKLGYVRGIVYLLVHREHLVLHEFSPCEVKRALTGNGLAEKDQLMRVVTKIFPGFVFSGRFDATDAIGLGLCGLWRSRIRRHP